MLITGLDNIKDAQTIRFPTHNDVRLRFPQYVKGYVTAIFNYDHGMWEYGYHETREEALAHFDTIKQLCTLAPDVMNWMQYSEMYIYSSFGHSKAKWSLLGVVVDE